MEELFRSLPSIIVKLGPNEQVIETLVLALWPRVAGDIIGKRSKAVRFSEKRLEIAVADEAWRKNLADLRRQLAGKLNKILGSNIVKQIDFFVDKSPTLPSSLGLVQGLPQTALGDDDLEPSVLKAADTFKSSSLRKQFVTTVKIAEGAKMRD